MPSSFYYPHTFKEALQTTLLDRLKVPSLLFVEGGSLQTIIPYALGKQVGILIDIGRLEARIIGVFNSLLQDTLQIVPVGFESLLRRVIEIVDDVNTLDDARTLVQSSLLGNVDSNDTNENDSSINLNIKHLVDEMFFDLSNPNSLVLAFFQSLSKCPVDLRKEMIRNVSIVGGGILGIPGFEKRFLVSIRNLFEKIEPDDGKGYFRLCDPSHRKFQPLAVVVMQSPLKINYPLPFSPSSIGWIGGSIMGSLNIPEDNWVNRDRFG
jgi:actin-related protein